MDEDLLVSGGKHVTDQLGVSITDVGHELLSLEATTNAVIDTLGLAPVRLQSVVSEKNDFQRK